MHLKMIHILTVCRLSIKSPNQCEIKKEEKKEEKGKNDGLFNIALEQLATSLRETNKGLLSHIQK